jgi:tetratricopeptide (TPR) repeat protein
MTSKNIYLIENHNEAYDIWEKNNIRNKILIHVDAHIDFEINHLIAFDKKFININNYIFPAVYKGIVNEIYWIIPGFNRISLPETFLLKRILRKISLTDYKTQNNILSDGKIISMNVFGVKLNICHINFLPKIAKKCLLDIDIDYFTNKNIILAQPSKTPFFKKTWISTDTFLSLIRKKIATPFITTICYSVNGGWTPLENKMLGDKLAYYFAPIEIPIKEILLTEKLLILFRKSLFLGNISMAKRYYYNLLNINPKLIRNISEYGMTLLRTNMVKRASVIFTRLIKINSKDCSFYYGLASSLISQEKYEEAEKTYQKILKINRKSYLAYLYLSAIKTIYKKPKSAKLYFTKYIKSKYPNKTNNFLNKDYFIQSFSLPSDIQKIFTNLNIF